MFYERNCPDKWGLLVKLIKLSEINAVENK